MTSIKAVNMLYYDDLDIFHINDWKIHTCNKRGSDGGPPVAQKHRSKTTQPTLLWLPPPLFKVVRLVPKITQAAARTDIACAGSTSAAPPATSRATNPRQHWPKDLSNPRRDIHLVEIKYCEDTRPQNQLNAAKEQHKDLCTILQGASVTLRIILLGVRGWHRLQHTHTHSDAF